METEVWKEIEYGSGEYLISNHGKVITLKRGKKRFLRLMKDTSGYYFIFMYFDKVRIRVRIHREVAKQFLEKNPDKLIVNHINGIKTDNRAENLEWSTYSENCKHSFDIGLSTRKNGERNGMSKITEKEVLEIRDLYPIYTQKELGKMYGIHFTSIGYIVNRKTWKHL